MAYNGTLFEGERAREVAVAENLNWTDGLGLSDELEKKVESIQIVHSSFKDPGPDWNRFDYFDASGKKLGSIQKAGF